MTTPFDLVAYAEALNERAEAYASKLIGKLSPAFRWRKEGWLAGFREGYMEGINEGREQAEAEAQHQKRAFPGPATLIKQPPRQP